MMLALALCPLDAYHSAMQHGGRERLLRTWSAWLTALVVVIAASAVIITGAETSRAGTNRVTPDSHAAAAGTCGSQTTSGYGSPAWTLCGIGGQGFTSPVTGTIDGSRVVVDASLTGMVYVVNARTGTEMPGWPQAATLVGNTATAIDSSPAIAYLDGPHAEPSIVVGLGSLNAPEQNGGVMAWNANGQVRFRFLTRKTFPEWGSKYPDDWTNSVFATPAIGDVTGSGQQDIVFGSYDHYVYALNPNGKLLPGFPINRTDTIWSSAALADTTHTGQMDIIEGGDASGWTGPGPGGTPCFSGWISDYRYEFGAPRLIWEHCLAETVWSSPAVTTFKSTPVVVVGTSWAYGPGRDTEPAEHEIYAYNASNGDLMPGWPVSAVGATFPSPAVAPLVAGGPDDVIDSSCTGPPTCVSDGPATVSAWNEAGHLLWRTVITSNQQVVGSPSVVAVAGSVDNDVLIGDSQGLYVLDAATGQKIEGSASTPLDYGCNTEGTPVTTAVPRSKTGYMMFTNCGFNGPNVPVTTYLRAYNVPAPATSTRQASGVSSALAWPMFRGNPQRTGVPDPNSITSRSCGVPTLQRGYRVLGKAGSVDGFGPMSSCGDLSSEIVPGEVAGMASRPDGSGYWIALSDGAVYAFGRASSYGDLRELGYRSGSFDMEPGAPIVGIAATADGKGYYLLGGDGSVYGFGDATYHGSIGGYRGAGEPVAIVTDASTGGYWIATSTGNVYGFDAPSYGEKTTGHAFPIVAMATMPKDNGYYLVTSSGYVYGFGAAEVTGDDPGGDIVGIAEAASGRGYYLLSRGGGVLAYGHAADYGGAGFGTEPAVAISTP
jgi:hypothetical protein